MCFRFSLCVVFSILSMSEILWFLVSPSNGKKLDKWSPGLPKWNHNRGNPSTKVFSVFFEKFVLAMLSLLILSDFRFRGGRYYRANNQHIWRLGRNSKKGLDDLSRNSKQYEQLVAFLLWRHFVLLFGKSNTLKTDRSWTWQRRAPRNDSDPSIQFFFNFHKQSKYEKHMMGKSMDICG